MSEVAGSRLFPDIASLEAPALMAASLWETRQQLLMPLEYIKNPEKEAIRLLADKISHPDNSQSIILLAHQLTSRELNLIFPLIMSGPGDGNTLSDELAGRVHLIIRERACLSLYVSGWLCFQYSYPNPGVAKALSLLCSILDIRRQGNAAATLPLISEIIAADARQFTKSLTRRLSELGLSLKNFMLDYGLAADLPLGAELISQAFLQGSAPMFAASHKLFSQVLKAADQPTQIKLLQHFFSLRDLKPAVWNRYCQIIYRQYGEPDISDPIWQKQKKKHLHNFRYWIKAATIGSHCHSQTQKAHLYLRYADMISKIESWDNNILIISFPGFIIADNKEQPDMAIYYDEDQAAKLLENPDKKRDPASPDTPRRRVDEAIRRNSGKGIVGLPFDEEGIRYSKIFLDMCLHDKDGFKTGKKRKSN